jgi:isoprene-epoxide---glutathione S-transferase
MITVYGYVPAWGLPDISPYVTKTINYLTFTNTPFEYRNQDLGTLGTDSPTAKLPYIIDDGEQINDSTRIVQHVKKKYGADLDEGMSAPDAAVALAFQRMVEEYTYWSGVIEPRWPTVEKFKVYVPYITGGPGLDELPQEVQDALLAFRDKIHDQHLKQGMGLRKHDDIVKCLQEDVDALSDFLGDKPYFMGDRIRSVDATIYSTIRHVADQPWPEFEGVAYIKGKKNLMAYADRLRDEFKV